MAEITNSLVVSSAMTATAASVTLTRTKSTSSAGIVGHSEIVPNSPAGVKINFFSTSSGASAGPLYVRVFGGATAASAATTANAQFSVAPNSSIVVPAGEGVLDDATYRVKISGILDTGGLGTMTAEWV